MYKLFKYQIKSLLKDGYKMEDIEQALDTIRDMLYNGVDIIGIKYAMEDGEYLASEDMEDKQGQVEIIHTLCNIQYGGK